MSLDQSKDQSTNTLSANNPITATNNNNDGDGNNSNVSPSLSAANSNSSPPMSPNGDYKIKCTLNGSDMHIFTLTEEEQHDYYKLCAKIKSAFNMKTEAQMLKYKIIYVDSDGDELTIANNQDLKEAIRMYPSQLKLNLIFKESVASVRGSVITGKDNSGAALSSGFDALTIRKESASTNSDRRGSSQASEPYMPRQSFKMSAVGLNNNGSLIQPAPVAGPDHPLYKTVECKHWAATQTCPRGNQCGFWHRGVDSEKLLNRRISVRSGNSPVQHSPKMAAGGSNSNLSSVAAQNTGGGLPRVSESGFKPYKACQYFINGKCMKGDQCTFSHSPRLCAAAAKEQQLQFAQSQGYQSGVVVGGVQLGLPVENKPNSRRHSTQTLGANTLGVGNQPSVDGTTTPTRRGFHQQAASMGSTSQFLGLGGDKLNQRLSQISQSGGQGGGGGANQRNHYKSEHGSEKVESSKSWRREDENNRNSISNDGNEVKTDDQLNQTSPTNEESEQQEQS